MKLTIDLIDINDLIRAKELISEIIISLSSADGESIADLNLATRPLTHLRAAGIYTIDDLCNETAAMLKRKEGIGLVTITDIRSGLRQINRALLGEII